MSKGRCGIIGVGLAGALSTFVAMPEAGWGGVLVVFHAGYRRLLVLIGVRLLVELALCFRGRGVRLFTVLFYCREIFLVLLRGIEKGLRGRDFFTCSGH